MTRPAHSTARRGLAALAVSGLLTAGLTAVAATPAHSDPDPACPTAASVASLTDGQAVHGLTVTKGTTPEEFTGEIEGVLEDGIAPGVDMILADLHSAAITKNGIWSGMSGSPVYDNETGDLIGAVAYSLGYGPSTIAGITPASEMSKLLDDGNLLDHPALAKKVALPRTLARKLVASKAATSAQAAGGLSQLRVPVSVSGLGSTRLQKVAPKLHISGGQVLGAPAGPASTEPIPIQTGGNLAAAISYGTVTLAGVGTATIVCTPDDEQKIVGFGHPMDFTGPSTMSLHGARALLIQDDSTGGSFKLANLGAPIGTVDQDRLTGIRGIPGDLPPASSITTTTKVADRESEGTTKVNLQEAVPELSFMHVAAVQDKVLNRLGKGSGSASWTIKGTRASGAPFELTRSDRFASSEDISGTTADAVASDVDAIANNRGEQVKIDSVDVDSSLSDAYATYKIAKIQVRSFGQWVTPQEDEPTPVHAGYVVQVRVTLTSREAAPKTVVVGIRTPKGAKNRIGLLHVFGGGQDEDDFFDDEDFGFFEDEGGFTGGNAPSSSVFPKLLASLKAQPTQNSLVVRMKFRAPGNAGKRLAKTTKLSTVVSGDGSFPIYGLR